MLIFQWNIWTSIIFFFNFITRIMERAGVDISTKYFLFIYPDFHCLFHRNVTVRHFETSGRRYFNVLDCPHICQFYYNDSVTRFEKSGRWYFNRKFRLSPFVVTIITILVAVISIESLYIFAVVLISIIFVSRFETWNCFTI